MRSSHKTRPAALVIAVFAMIVAGCASDGAGGSGGSKKSSAAAPGQVSGPRTPGGIRDGEYYSQAWLSSRGYDQVDPALLPQKDPPIVRDSSGRALDRGALAGTPPPQPPTGTMPSSGLLGMSSSRAPSGPIPPLPSEVADQQASGVWSLVLATFTEGDHVAAAQRMISETARIAPQVSGLRVHPTNRGSMVVYGEYASREDKKAQDDRTWLKTITYENRPVFPRIALTHLNLRPQQPDLHPYDLLYARRAHPRVRTMYTLDIAVWDDLGSGRLSYDDIRRSAERYARQLRTQGYEAYFHHDDVAKRSVVTVGLFDQRAINKISGLYSDEVTELLKKFPVRLVNGEPMYEYRNRFRPELGAKPQTPALAEVPDK